MLKYNNLACHKDLTPKNILSGIMKLSIDFEYEFDSLIDGLESII